MGEQKKPRVMIVEDEAIVAEHLRDLLSSLGYEADHAASTGEKAVELAELTRPNLVLMDIMLGGTMDGIQAAELIRQRCNIPVVYLSAFADESLLQRAKVTEPFGYLLKPFRKQNLRIFIEMALYKAKTDAALRESEEKYRELAELLPQYVYETDAAGNISFANRSAMDALGLTHKDLAAGVSFLKTAAESGREFLRRKLDEVLSGEKMAGVQFSAVGKDGMTFPVVLHANPIVRGGDVVGTRCVFVDITEQKNAEQALRAAHDQLEIRVGERTQELAESNERLTKEVEERARAEESATRSQQLFQAVFDSAADSIFIKDTERRYSLVNPEMENLLGMSSTEIIGRTDEELFDPLTARHLKSVDERALSGESIEEEHARTILGVDFVFHDARVPLRDNLGRIIGMCGISRNITERRRTEHSHQATELDYPSPTMKKALQKALQAAGTDSIVLLLGESGSGKDHLARWIHNRSARANGPFFCMNCAALPQELAESELFGHESGAFTGARGRVRGLLELAEGGTLLLNEIGELPLPLQAKLLTFLDTREFCRLGGRKSIRVNARLIAATNRDIEIEVADGRFRQDLFFRINVLSIRVPSLQERSEDIPLLVNELMEQLASELQLSHVPPIDIKTMRRLSNYHWPGNVRELRNVLERGVILSGGGGLTLEGLGSADEQTSGLSWEVSFPPKPSLTDSIADLTQRFVGEAMRVSDGNQLQAAKILGISRYALIRHLKKLGSASDYHE